MNIFEKFEKNETAFANREQFSAHVKQFSKTAFMERVARIISERKRI